MTGRVSDPKRPDVRPRALLALEDGSVFEGLSFGSAGETTGEVVFNTALCGYQEVLTDPSYAGQIVTMTYPHIGNYGVNREDVESTRPQVAGFVVRESATVVSSWRASGSLGAYLERARHRGDQRDRHARAHPAPAHVRRQARCRLGARPGPRLAGAQGARLALDGRPRPRARGHLREAVGLRPADRDGERGRASAAGAEGHRRASSARGRDSVPRRGLRLRDEAQHPAQPLGRRLRRDRGARDHVGRRGDGASSRRRLPLERAGRPRAVHVRDRGGEGVRGPPAHLRHLPRPPDPGAGLRRQDLQAQVRPPRRQPPGEEPRDRPGRDHLAEPRLLRGPGAVRQARVRAHAQEPQRRHRRGFPPCGTAR